MKVYEVYERTDESCGERKTFLRERDAQAYKKHLKGNWCIAEHEILGKIPKYWRIDGGQYYNSRSHPDENPTLTGFVGFGCSFGGKWFGGYAHDKRGDDYCGQAKCGVMRDLTGLKNATFICGDYRDVAIPKHSVVYADPPYEKSTKYSTGDFDHTAFWDYMRQLAKQGHKVFISEEHAPDDFMCIWHKEKIRTLKKDDNVNMVRTEKLWTI